MDVTILERVITFRYIYIYIYTFQYIINNTLYLSETALFVQDMHHVNTPRNQNYMN